ncbi:hypothetical protein LAB1_56710 [Roseibium sp. LAB1]
MKHITVGKKEFFTFLASCIVFFMFKIFGVESKYLDKAQIFIIILAIFFAAVFLIRFLRGEKMM